MGWSWVEGCVDWSWAGIARWDGEGTGATGDGVGWHYEMGHSRACGTHEIARRRADRRINCIHLVLGEVQQCEAGPNCTAML